MEALRRITIEGVSSGPVPPVALQTIRAFRGSGLNVTLHPLLGREPWYWARSEWHSIQGVFDKVLEIDAHYSYFRYCSED